LLSAFYIIVNKFEKLKNSHSAEIEG
jgi:hypothetical protein